MAWPSALEVVAVFRRRSLLVKRGPTSSVNFALSRPQKNAVVIPR